MQVLLGRQHGELPLDVDQHPAQPLLDRQGLEQGLPLGHRDVEVAGDQVGEAARILEAAQHLADGVFGQARLLGQLGGAGLRFFVEGDEGRILEAQRGQVLERLDHRLEVALGRGFDAQDARPLAGEKQHLNAGEAPLHLLDAGDGADREEAVGIDLGSVLALGERQRERFVRRILGSFDRFQGGRPPHRDRHGDSGEEYELAQRQNGKNQWLGHLSASHSGRGDGARRVERSAKRAPSASQEQGASGRRVTSNVDPRDSIPKPPGIPESGAYRSWAGLSELGLDPRGPENGASPAVCRACAQKSLTGKRAAARFRPVKGS